MNEKLKSVADRAMELFEQKTPHQLAVELVAAIDARDQYIDQLKDATQQRAVMAELLAQASTQLQIVFERDATYWDFHGLVPRIDAVLAGQTGGAA